jgi:hypothetical protein
MDVGGVAASLPFLKAPSWELQCVGRIVVSGGGLLLCASSSGSFGQLRWLFMVVVFSVKLLDVSGGFP